MKKLSQSPKPQQQGTQEKSLYANLCEDNGGLLPKQHKMPKAPGLLQPENFYHRKK
jgi:hypothetical protein